MRSSCDAPMRGASRCRGSLVRGHQGPRSASSAERPLFTLSETSRSELPATTAHSDLVRNVLYTETVHSQHDSRTRGTSSKGRWWVARDEKPASRPVVDD